MIYQRRQAMVGDVIVGFYTPTGALGFQPPKSLVGRFLRAIFGSELFSLEIPPGATLRITEISPRAQILADIGATEEVTFVKAQVGNGFIRLRNGRVRSLRMIGTPGATTVVALTGDEVDTAEIARDTLRAAGII